ncbi:MAG TPA: glucosamine-6-phosphate deaminase [Candidatus Acidoferrum sp.]|nr:glucosamine-6-phosphate deaminase [Candidatus Acidoferrum sp.]
MVIKTYDEKASLGRSAAEQAAVSLCKAIQSSGKARIIAATGASQFEFLDALTAMPNIEWARVEMFHLDEYIGLPVSHPASFRKYLHERLINKTGITKYHFLDGEGDVPAVVRSVSAELTAAPIDIAFVGIGENGHLAFNDPPADFQTEEPYIIVDLDEPCRRQQVGEGWFKDLSEVPKRAISMSVRQILRAKEILCIVPDARKAQAVKSCFEDEVSPHAPASILRTHANTTVFLDQHSAALLSPEKRKAFA